MCRTLDRKDVYVLFTAHLKDMEKIRGTAITTFKYEDMWKLLNEELIDNEFNWLQKRINGHLKEYVFFNRIQECI